MIPFGMDRINNAVVNHTASSFSLSGECSYLPDTGSHARNNKRILSIRSVESVRRSREWGYKARRGIRSKSGGKEKEEEEEEGLVEGYDVLGLVRLFDVGREKSALYLTPNQLRSAVPDKSLSLLPFSFAIEWYALNVCVCVCIRVVSIAAVNQHIQWHSRGRPANTKSSGAKYIEWFSYRRCPIVSFVSSNLRIENWPLYLPLACMHPGNELSLATL